MRVLHSVQVTLINNIVNGPVTNADGSPNSTTLHFHGIREVGIVNQTTGEPEKGYKKFGPWSDGVPFVNQCPVPGGNSKSKDNTFTYTFRAGSNPHNPDDFNAPAGTYWYHSHVGAQRTNGLQGGLVIKDSITKADENNCSPVDHQVWIDESCVIDHPANQTIIVQEWYEDPTCQVPVRKGFISFSSVPSSNFSIQ